MSQSGSDFADSSPEASEDGAPLRRAGAFDIRNFIALLLGTYGVVLVVLGVVGTGARALARAGGFNVNLWAGVGMVVVAAAFAVWARARPVLVPSSEEEEPEAASVPR
jgi:hypothetical protein